MRYFVIGDDGQKYGPADVNTLNEWITDNRLIPTQQLEEETSGMRIAAGAVQGLNFPLQGTQPAVGVAQPGAPGPQQFGAGQPYQQYYNRPQYMGDNGAEDLKKAWIYAVIGFFCCIFLQIPAFIFAGRAADKGNPGAKGVRIFIAVAVVLQIVLFIIRFLTVMSHFNSPR